MQVEWLIILFFQVHLAGILFFSVKGYELTYENATESFEFLRFKSKSTLPIEIWSSKLPTIQNVTYFCHDIRSIKQNNDCKQCIRGIDMINTIRRSRTGSVPIGLTANITKQFIIEDVSVKYLKGVYEGIQNISSGLFSSRDYLEMKDGSNVMTYNIMKYNKICIFGGYSLQILRGIILTHESLLKHTHSPYVSIKYFIQHRNSMKTSLEKEEDYVYLAEPLLSISDIYLQTKQLEDEFSFLKLNTYFMNDGLESIQHKLLYDCEIIHIRELRKKRLLDFSVPPHHFATDDIIDALQLLEMKEEKKLQQTILSIILHIPSFLHHNHNIPIIYEKGRFSTSGRRNDWEIELMMNNGETFGILQWHSMVQSKDGILYGMADNDEFHNQSCGYSLMLFHSLFAYLHVETYIGEIVPPINLQTTINNAQHFDSWISAFFSQNNENLHNLSSLKENSSQDNMIVTYAILFITYDLQLFLETAHGLQVALHQAGYSKVYIMGIFDYALYHQFLLYGQEKHIPVIQIALGPQRPTMLIDKYIVFHTENTWDSFIAFDDSYVDVVKNALAVFVYSSANIEFIHSIGRYDDLYVIPMFSQSLYFRASFSEESINESKIDIREFSDLSAAFELDNSINTDICFLGSISPRRTAFAEIYLITQNSFSVRLGSVAPFFDAYDLYTKEYIILHCKVMLNIHQYEESILETHRINHLLSLGKVIISERSSVDPRLDGEYEEQGAVIFVALEEMYDTAAWWLLHEEARQAQEKRALEKYVSLQANVSSLQHAMLDIIALL